MVRHNSLPADSNDPNVVGHQLIHRFYNTDKMFRHSLIVNGIEGELANYREVARNGPYAATSSYFDGTLPAVFYMVDLTVPIETVNELPDGYLKK